MNEAYAPMGITFDLALTDFTTVDDWAAAELHSDAEANMKSALKQGTYGELDLYFMSDLGGNHGLLGQ